MGSIVVGSVVAVPTNVQYTMLIGENSTKFQKWNDENFRTIVGLLKYLHHCSTTSPPAEVVSPGMDVFLHAQNKNP